MKLLVFAHKPPPHHGQSYMVELLLDSLGARAGVGQNRPEATTAAPTGKNPALQCYHVDCRFSTGMEDIGRMRWGKVLLIVKFCAQALWYRFRYGARFFYYIPTPPAVPSALYRDWMVMALCRPFFRATIFHWHAAGLGAWLEKTARPWQRAVTQKLLGRPDLSIVLADYNRADALHLQSRQTVIVPNGIPDPCPAFEQDVLPRRRARARLRNHLANGLPASPAERAEAGQDPEIFKVLFIGMCTASKGLFDAMAAVALLHKQWAHQPLRVQLSIAGNFSEKSERELFAALVGQYQREDGWPLVRYEGFVSGEQKKRLFLESDCLCFPTYYAAESFGLVLVEAMAVGLPVVTTRWRMIPDLLPRRYPGLVEPHAPEQVAAALQQVAKSSDPAGLRQHFLENFTVRQFANRMETALRSLETSLEKQP